MDALKPFNFKLATLTMRGGFFTKFAALAHSAAAAAVVFMNDSQRIDRCKLHRDMLKISSVTTHKLCSTNFKMPYVTT